jgi:hypothetical protein
MKELSLLLGLIMTITTITSASCVTREVSTVETYYITENQTETYTETENVVVKTVEDRERLSPVFNWQTNLYFDQYRTSAAQLTFPKPSQLTYYYGYSLGTGQHSRSQVEINLSKDIGLGDIRVIDLTGMGQIPIKPEPPINRLLVTETWAKKWLDDLNVVFTNPERVLGTPSTGADGNSQIIFDTAGITEFAIFANTWNRYAVKNVELVWADDIIEPRTVTKERQVPVQVEKQRTVTTTEKVPFWEAVFGK